MEATMMKPEVKKKPKPPKPPPKPAEFKRHDFERPTPLIPARPTDSELTHTQYRMKNAAATDNEASGNFIQRTTKAKPSVTPVPPRATEKELNATTRHSHRSRVHTKDTQSSRENNQSEVPKDKSNFKQSNQTVLTGIFRRCQKEKTSTFTSYVIDDRDKEEKSDDVPTKQAPDNKPDSLRGATKGLQVKASTKVSTGPSPDPSDGQLGSEKEESTEKKKQEQNAETKQDLGGLISGIFRKTPKEKLPPSLTVNAAEDDPEDTDDAEEKSSKLSSENLSVNSELSASSDSLSKNNSNKEKGGFFSGMFKKHPKTAETAPTDEDQQSQHDSLSGSTDNLSENSKEKGGFFSGMLRKSPKVPREETTWKDKELLEADPSESNETENNTAKENLSVNSELSASSDSLSEINSNKEKGGFFSGMFKKHPKTAETAPTDEDQQSQHDSLSGSTDNLSENSKEKGGFFSGMLRKSPKVPREETTWKDKELLEADPSESSETENNTAKEKGGLFSGMFKKSPKLSEAPRLEEEAESLHDRLSASTDSLSENKEKGSLFSGFLRKTPKTTGEENLQAQKDLSASNNSLSETAKLKEKHTQEAELSSSSEALSEQTNTKDKGGIFSGIFKKAPKPAEPSQHEEDDSPDNDLSASNEDVSEIKQEKGAGLFGGLLKKTPKPSGDRTELLDKEAQRELSTSNDDLSESNTTKEKNIFSNMFKKPQKPAEGATADKELAVTSENQLSVSCENLSSTTTQKEKKGGLAGIFKRSTSIDNLFDEEKGGLFSGLIKKTPKASELGASAEELNHNDNKMLFSSSESLPEAATTKEKTGGLTGIFKKPPKPAPRSATTTDPLRDTEELSDSGDSLLENAEEKKGGLGGIFRRTPKVVEPQESVDMEDLRGGGLGRKRTIKKKRRVVSFRVKTTKTPNPIETQSSDAMPVIEEAVEMQDLNPAQDSSDELEVQPVEMAAYPTEYNPVESDLENDELIEWWNTVKGWVEWNETNNFGEGDEQQAMEQAADRVYMAARLFVRLFNQRGASLQHRILELLALADAADQFHKKTVSAAIGGGVASVAGSVATITGLILAPFTFGASIIVTAVGIGVATAGSITSATANITDTVHSNMDRKKLEKMIQGYQEEIKVIRECLEFLQAGMDALQEWDFEKYSESAAKKAMNHNLKHVMKEGGRAGKALMINTDKLISTVQILGVAGGAAKAAQAISVTTGVMSALFLALDVFFLAKDSHELRKGAKTKFATKIRDVCKELQDGLLELNKVKTQLQKTMDGIEVEAYEEIEEVEVEEEDDFESDPKKLAELEQELDLLEEKLDMKAKEEQERNKVIESEKESLKNNKEKNEEKSLKENKESKDKIVKDEVKKDDKKAGKKGKGEGENKLDSKSEKITDEEKEQKNKTFKVAEDLKEQSQKERKKDKETENRITAGKEKQDKSDTAKESSIKSKTDEEEKERSKSGKEPEEVKIRSGNSKQEHPSRKVYSERAKTERENERSKSGREEERVMNKEAESVSMRRHSSRSDKDRPQRGESKHETKGIYEDRVSSRQRERTESWRRREEERGVRDEGVETVKSRERSNEGRESRRDLKREDHGKNDGRKESHLSHETSRRRERSEREGGREESDSKRSQERRGPAPHGVQWERRDEKRESKVERTKSHLEGAESEERRRRREDGGSQRRDRERRVDGESQRKDGERRMDGESQRKDRERRGSERDREHGHSHRGSRSQSSALLEDGLYI